MEAICINHVKTGDQPGVVAPSVVTCLSCMHENLSLLPPEAMLKKNAGRGGIVVACTYNPSLEGRDMGIPKAPGQLVTPRPMRHWLGLHVHGPILPSYTFKTFFEENIIPSFSPLPLHPDP